MSHLTQLLMPDLTSMESKSECTFDYNDLFVAFRSLLFCMPVSLMAEVAKLSVANLLTIYEHELRLRAIN